jgi:hypothetical protein
VMLTTLLVPIVSPWLARVTLGSKPSANPL